MTFDVRSIDLGVLNSLTKYPSIPTYHALDPKNGNLLEETVKFTGQVIGTEKINGANARIIFLPDGSYIIGSREELLYAKGDLIGHPMLGIVDVLKSYAENSITHGDQIVVEYFEVYGGKITEVSKQYTHNRAVGFRLFDMIHIKNYEELLNQSREQAAAWRDAGNQQFFSEVELLILSSNYELVPRLFAIPAEELPTSVDGMHEFLMQRIPATQSALDPDASGKAEGIVLRSADRSVIAKARFEDYERTIRRRNHNH